MRVQLGYTKKEGREAIYVTGLGERLYWVRNSSRHYDYEQSSRYQTVYTQTGACTLHGDQVKAAAVLTAMKTADAIEATDRFDDGFFAGMFWPAKEGREYDVKL